MFIFSIWPDIRLFSVPGIRPDIRLFSLSGIRPDIRLFSVSGIRPDIRQVKSGIQPHTGYKKKAGLSAGLISGASLQIIRPFSLFHP
jgi:hypothetical protein